MGHDIGPVVLINVFTVDPPQADALVEAWTADADFFKHQPGFISTQLHRGIAGSGVFMNYAVWESVNCFHNTVASGSTVLNIKHLANRRRRSPWDVRSRTSGSRELGPAEPLSSPSALVRANQTAPSFRAR